MRHECNFWQGADMNINSIILSLCRCIATATTRAWSTAPLWMDSTIVCRSPFFWIRGCIWPWKHPLSSSHLSIPNSIDHSHSKSISAMPTKTTPSLGATATSTFTSTKGWTCLSLQLLPCTEVRIHSGKIATFWLISYYLIFHQAASSRFSWLINLPTSSEIDGPLQVTCRPFFWRFNGFVIIIIFLGRFTIQSITMFG